MTVSLDQAFDHSNRQSRTDGYVSSIAVCRQDRNGDERDHWNARAGNTHPMNRCNRSWERVIAGVGLGMLMFDGPAIAADMPLKAPVLKAVYDWTGFYVGGAVGYGGGNLGAGTNTLPEQGAFFQHSSTGFIGGFDVGYLKQFPNHVVLGIEADASFTSPVDSTALTPAPFNTTLDYIGTVRGRVGYAFGTLMPYVTGGFAWGHSHVDINDSGGSIVAAPGQYQSGWTAGAGVEFAVSGNWSARLEYDYIDLAHRTYDLSGFGLPGLNVEPNINLVKIGLNYRFGDTAALGRAGFHQRQNRASGIGRLECPCPDDLYSNGLSGIPFALCGNQQPSGRWTDPGNLDRHGLRGRAVVAGRRILFRPGNGAGLRPRRHARTGRLSERRGAKGRRRVPQNSSAALLPSPDFRSRRRAGRRSGWPQINCRANATSTASR